jgi:hypothetical protein
MNDRWPITYCEPVRNYNRTIQILRSQFYEKRSNRIRLLADQWPRSFTRKGTPSFNPYRPSAIDGHKVLSLHDSRSWRRRPPRGSETIGFANPTNPSTILQLAHPLPNRWFPESNSPNNCSRHQAQAPAHGGALICSHADAASPNSPPRLDPNDTIRCWEEGERDGCDPYHESVPDWCSARLRRNCMAAGEDNVEFRSAFQLSSLLVVSRRTRWRSHKARRWWGHWALHFPLSPCLLRRTTTAYAHSDQLPEQEFF